MECVTVLVLSYTGDPIYPDANMIVTRGLGFDFSKRSSSMAPPMRVVDAQFFQGGKYPKICIEAPLIFKNRVIPKA